jgi:release factor glutamine methyltransferase
MGEILTGTTQELIGAATRRLAEAGSTSARLDAQLLLSRVTGWSRTSLLAHPERLVSAAQGEQFQRLVNRRAAAEPIAYLVGEREFYGRVFKVDRRALIPRPEKEVMVELGADAVARWRANGVEPRVVEVGTGAGGVAISLAGLAHVPVVATDVSFGALTLARENAGLHGLAGSIRLVQADLLAGLPGPWHVVLANLPYVPSGRVLPPDVKDYEPHVAIFGGARGTELLERFLRETCALLAAGAELCLELDEEEQATPMAAFARQTFPGAQIEIRQDGGGYDRVLRILTLGGPARAGGG